MVRSKDPKTNTSSTKKRTKIIGQKTIGLFDHIKHIRTVQNPDYYNNLSEADRKSFNHFMILQALSMNPDLLMTVSTLYRFFDVVPSPQFYQLLISLIPSDSTYYPWIKSKYNFNKDLIELVSNRFEVSSKEAEEYVNILSSTDEGVKSLVTICQGYGKSDEEITKLLSTTKNDNE